VYNGTFELGLENKTCFLTKQSFDSAFTPKITPTKTSSNENAIFKVNPGLTASKEFNITRIILKILSIIDSLTYSVYIKCGDTVKYVKGLSFWKTHRINADDKISTGILGKDISIKFGFSLLPSIRERAIKLAVNFKVRKLWLIQNKEMPLEIIAFFRIPDSKDGKSDHLVLLGYASEDAPRFASLRFSMGTNGKASIDLINRKAIENLTLIAGIGRRVVDKYGNVALKNLTRFDIQFAPPPSRFNIVFDTSGFALDPINVTIQSSSPVTILSSVRGRNFSIEFLFDKINESILIGFSWSKGILECINNHLIDKIQVKAIGDFKNATFIDIGDVNYINNMQPVIYGDVSNDAENSYIYCFGREIFPIPDYVSISIEDIFKIMRSMPLIIQNNITTIYSIENVGASNKRHLTLEKGYQLEMKMCGVSADFLLHWRDFTYASFITNLSIKHLETYLADLSKPKYNWSVKEKGFIGGLLGNSFYIKFANIHIQNVSLNLSGGKGNIIIEHVDSVPIIFWIGTKESKRNLNITGCINSTPHGLINITFQPNRISYRASSTINNTTVVINYSGLKIGLSMLGLPEEMEILWNLTASNISINMSKPIDEISVFAACNYTSLLNGSFPDPPNARKDLVASFKILGIPSFYVNWSDGIEYGGKLSEFAPVSEIQFKILKADNQGNFIYYEPLSGEYYLTFYAIISSLSLSGLEVLGINARLFNPQHIKYNSSENRIYLKMNTGREKASLEIRAFASLDFIPFVAYADILFHSIPENIEISFDTKDFNNFHYNASDGCRVTATVECGDPSILSRLPPPTGLGIKIRLKYWYGLIAVRGLLDIDIPKEMNFWYFMGDDNRFMIRIKGVNVSRGVDINCYVDSSFIQNSIFRFYMTNIPDEIFVSVNLSDMKNCYVSYQASCGIGFIFTGIHRPDNSNNSKIGWAAYVNISDIPKYFSIGFGMDEYPHLDYDASSAGLDISVLLNGSRFKGVINFPPPLAAPPFLYLKIIDLPSCGVALYYSDIMEAKIIAKTEDPSQKIGEIYVNFNAILKPTFDGLLSFKKGLMNLCPVYISLFDIGIYGNAILKFTPTFGIKNFVFILRRFNYLECKLDTLELIVKLNGEPDASFMMNWSLSASIDIEMSLKVGVYVSIGFFVKILWWKIKFKIKTWKRDIFKVNYKKESYSLDMVKKLCIYQWEDKWRDREIGIKHIIRFHWKWPHIKEYYNKIYLTKPGKWHIMVLPRSFLHIHIPKDILDGIARIYVFLRYWHRFWKSIRITR